MLSRYAQCSARLHTLKHVMGALVSRSVFQAPQLRLSISLRFASHTNYSPIYITSRSWRTLRYNALTSMRRCKSQTPLGYVDLTDAHRCSTEANALRSPLLRLPAELRNKIYACIFTGAVVRLRTSFSTKTDAIVGSTAFSLLTCHQLRHETSTILFSQVVFDLTGYEIRHLLRVSGGSGPKVDTQICDHIKSIVMCSKTILYLHENANSYTFPPLSGIACLPRLKVVRVRHGMRIDQHFRKCTMKVALRLLGPEVQVLDADDLN